MITQIPAPRVPFIDERSGQISREWYIFLFQIKEKINLSTGFLSSVGVVTANTSPDNNILHVMASGTITIQLQLAINRDSVLTVTNIGTGIITILPAAGEVIQDDVSKELDFQWTTVQLCPTLGGYVII